MCMSIAYRLGISLQGNQPAWGNHQMSISGGFFLWGHSRLFEELSSILFGWRLGRLKIPVVEVLRLNQGAHNFAFSTMILTCPSVSTDPLPMNFLRRNITSLPRKGIVSQSLRDWLGDKRSNLSVYKVHSIPHLTASHETWCIQVLSLSGKFCSATGIFPCSPGTLLHSFFIFQIHVDLLSTEIFLLNLLPGLCGCIHFIQPLYGFLSCNLVVTQKGEIINVCGQSTMFNQKSSDEFFFLGMKKESFRGLCLLPPRIKSKFVNYLLCFKLQFCFTTINK